MKNIPDTFRARIEEKGMTIKATAEKTKNTTIWIKIFGVNIVVTAAATAPTTNQIDTNWVVAASQIAINTAKPIQINGIYFSISPLLSYLSE